MSLNNQIDKLIEKNKRLKPVNMTHYDNPFLLLSETRALNELVTNTLPSSRAEVKDIEPNDSHVLGSGLTIYEPSETDAENLSRHVMNEVYQSPENRREIEGYTMLNSFGDDRHLVYKSNKSNTILYGIRGTKPSSGSDWLTDLSIASKALRQILPFDKRDYLEAPMNERYDNANNIYRQLRELYPKSKIILGGHSLGNSVGLDILYKHQADNNIELYGYNGFYHPVYTGKKDPRNHPQRTEGDIVSWWNSDKAKTFKTPVAKGVQISGAVVVGGYVANKIRKIKALEGRIKAGNELYANRMVIQNRGGPMASMRPNAEGVMENVPEPVMPEGTMAKEIDELEAFLKNDPDARALQWDASSKEERHEMLREINEKFDSEEAGVIGAEDSAIMSETISGSEEQRYIEYLEQEYSEFAEARNITVGENSLAAVSEYGPITGYALLILGIAYGFYSHLSGHFEPEQNRFIYKKQKLPRIKTGF